MAFNKEDKPTYNELAPSLQALIDSKAHKTDIDDLEAKLSKLYTNVGLNRVTIGTIGQVKDPIENKEILFDTSDKMVKGYFKDTGWYHTGAVYS